VLVVELLTKDLRPKNLIANLLKLSQNLASKDVTLKVDKAVAELLLNANLSPLQNLIGENQSATAVDV
tara:strand:+ start:281 stop:484 length:204 start_codon:yes stop_codon:yes gene_type:complete